MRLGCYNIRMAFEVTQPKKFPGVLTVVLSTRTTRNNDEVYYNIPFLLSNLFRKYIDQFESFVKKEIRRGGPKDLLFSQF